MGCLRVPHRAERAEWGEGGSPRGRLGALARWVAVGGPSAPRPREGAHNNNDI